MKNWVNDTHLYEMLIWLKNDYRWTCSINASQITNFKSYIQSTFAWMHITHENTKPPYN